MNWTYNTGLNGVVQIVLCECDVHPTASVYRVTLLECHIVKRYGTNVIYNDNDHECV